jgi:hypothetical protein
VSTLEEKLGYVVTVFPDPKKPVDANERRALAVRQFPTIEGIYRDHTLVFRIGRSFEAFGLHARVIAHILGTRPQKFTDPRGSREDWIVFSEAVFGTVVYKVTAEGRGKLALLEPGDESPVMIAERDI